MKIMKKIFAFCSFLMLVTLFSACKKEQLTSYGGISTMKYWFSVEEIMSRFSSSEPLTSYISLDNLDVYEDILVDIRKGSDIPVTREIEISQVLITDVSLSIFQTEVGISEIVNSLLIDAELIMLEEGSTEEIVIADFTANEATSVLDFIPSTEILTQRLKGKEFNYYFRLNFSEKPEVDFIKMIPNVSFDYEFETIDE